LQKTLHKNFFKNWLSFTKTALDERRSRADEFFVRNLKTKCLESWMQHSFITLSKYQVSII